MKLIDAERFAKDHELEMSVNHNYRGAVRDMLEAPSVHPNCTNCKHYASYEGVCCNADSGWRADFRGVDNICEKWEGEE